MTDIRTARITTPYALSCPACADALLWVHPTSTEVPGRRYWLKDGDTIPGLWDALSEVQRAPDGFDFELMVGDCPSCGEDYYAVYANFMSASETQAGEYLHFNMTLGATLHPRLSGVLREVP